MKQIKEEKKLRIGISHGDINGISYEIIIKTLMDNRLFELFTPIMYGSSKIVAYHRKALNITNFSMNNIKTPADANPKRANIINCIDENTRVELGKSTQMAGEASFRSLERAVEDIKKGEVDILITAPINKHNIQVKGFDFPGHTEYLKTKFDASDVLMLMVSENFRVGVVTGHIPLKNVSEAVTKEAILSKLRILNKSLIEDFAITNPKIAVLGLNPHAGDNGLIGSEEQNIIRPAIDVARKENIMALGPYPADGLFGSDDYQKFDAILAMYHDQGLAPFKSLVFSKGVNYTAGLPFVRTSPAHGTAYDLAGKNKATPESFRQALYLAIDIHKNRQRYKELTASKLKKQNVQKTS
ncbi:MAG: 4-hydroxythreonine-4-phosphate dehydrogenase PdxA [Bacteroidetes bacterium 4572_117]|nr:MAG: 4-hydroxythreonine-4-phosphate dehydrogenase PdxA [Bacteroidetes bacterium 4572_117]